MNRRQKIIVSITGIILVSLILIGLTYAYFLTKITGNTNEKSISVSTANLQIKYNDNSEEILGKDLVLEPSDNEIGSKTFTVTNEGNANTSYVVVIENVSITNSSDGKTTTFESNDFRYTLTCTKKDDTSCEQTTTQSIFPINGGILVSNSIDVSDVQTYTLKMWYIDTGIDQSNDMGKTLQAKINIKDITQVENPYSSNTNSLAYNIIENAKNKTNGTELVASPKTKPAEETSSFIYEKGTEPTSFTSTLSNATNYYISYADDYKVNESTGRLTLINPIVATSKYTTDMTNTLVGKYAVWSTSTSTVSDTQDKYRIYKISTNVSDITSTIKYATISPSSLKTTSTEKELSITSDNYGTSYYYRGGVEDNYVNFAGMCWRIVRIAGDGSIKLILEDQNTTCNDPSYTGNWNIGNTNFGYDSSTYQNITVIDYLNPKTDSEYSQVNMFKTFQTSKLSKHLDKLKAGDWCYNDAAYNSDTSTNETLLTDEQMEKIYNDGESKIFFYESYIRLKGQNILTPTNQCNGTILNKYNDNSDMYVATLTLDEVVFAGSKYSFGNPYYLVNDYKKNNNIKWLTFSPAFWAKFSTLSPSIFFVSYDGSYSNTLIEDKSVYARPSISLLSNIQISNGNGTKETPYVIE